MAALEANRVRYYTGNVFEDDGPVGVDSDEFYVGQLLAINSSGKAVPASDAASVYFLGVCKARVTTAGSNTLRIPFQRGQLEWFPKSGTIVLGQNVTVVDDNTVGVASGTTHDVVVGCAVKAQTIDTVDGVWVQIGVGAPVIDTIA